MDFSDLSSYPMVANTDYSPTLEPFSYSDTLDKAYLADSYTTSPDHSLSTFLDCDPLFDRPVTSVELPNAFVANAKSQTVFNSTLPAVSYPPNPQQPQPFGQLDHFPQTAFTFDTLTSDPCDASAPTYPLASSPSTSPLEAHSPTPSLCGDSAPFPAPPSPSLSPLPLKRESPSSPIEPLSEPLPKRPQRKRGRPRLDRTASSDAPSTASQKNPRTTRLPHNQVERKYREGLNSELERLRRAVPTLPQAEEGSGSVMGQPKPSKAMVLAGAIEYIKKIERERDVLYAEVERLRSRGVQWE